MAIDQWIGVTDGDLQTATNFKSGVALASGDALLVPKTATQAINASLDLSAITLVGMETEKDSSVIIGTFTAAGLIVPAKFTMLHSAAYGNVTLAGSGEAALYFANYGTIFVNEAPAASSVNYGLNLTGIMDGTGDGKIFITAESGSIGIAANSGEILEAEEINITNATVTIGSGVVDPDGSTALPLLNVTGGTVINRAAVAVLNVDDSDFRHESGAVTTATIKAGTMTVAGAVTLTTVYARANTTLDMTGDLQAKTITDLYVGSGVTLDFRGGHVTITNAIHLQGCSVSDLTILLDPEQAISFD